MTAPRTHMPSAGHFLKAGFPEDKVAECHGSIHFLQAFDSSLSSDIWPAEPHLRNLKARLFSESFERKGSQRA